MRLKEANELQLLVAETHPWLEVDIKGIEDGYRGRDTYVCYVEGPHFQYYIWCTSDWLTFKVQRAKTLNKYTNKGREEATDNWRKSRVASKKGKVA